jgi:hypothetical protein
MYQNIEIKYVSKALISMVLFFIVILLCALPNEKVFSEQKSHLIQTSETPSRILTDGRDTGDDIFSPTNDYFSTHPTLVHSPLLITIIESQSMGHVMDTIWLGVANFMGHTGTIVPQTTMDDSNFFSTTDILIISSGVIDIPTNRRIIIEQYVQQGGPVYIQGEFSSSFEPNQTFQSIVDSLGGSFSWGATVSGDLVPMNVLGTLSNTPNSVPTLSYFWWGCEGSGDTTIENYLEYGGQYFGFIFTPPNPNYGPVITNSDQDWAQSGLENRLLMENIITYLSMTVVSVEEEQFDVPREYFLLQNHPNPFLHSTTINYTIPGIRGQRSGVSRNNLIHVKLSIYDVLGRLVETLVDEHQESGVHQVEWDSRTGVSPVRSGIYFYKLQLGSDIGETKKMMLIH